MNESEITDEYKRDEIWMENEKKTNIRQIEDRGIMNTRRIPDEGKR